MTDHRHEQGFSLIEVIVALGILSTAAISLSALSQGSLSGVKQLEARYLARVIADNQLANTFMQDVPLRVGITEGEAVQLGQTFTWLRTIAATPEQGLLLVEVQVSAPGTDSVLVKTSTLRELSP